MKDLHIPLEEQILLESWIITSHLSSLHYDLTSAKKFKKIVKNDSWEAFKINSFNYYKQVTKKELSEEARAKFDDYLYHSEKSCSLLRSFTELKLYPNPNFPLWNKHLEIYDTLEKTNFYEKNAQNMQSFLARTFSIPEYEYIEINVLKDRDFNRSLS